MDQFGQETIKTDDNKFINIPRAILCRTVYRDIDSLIMSKSNVCSYTVSPYIVEKGYTDKESLYKVKHSIWANLFNFGNGHSYDEERHYPYIFSLYLKGKLNLNIANKERLDTFIEHVRNYMFVYVTYTCSPDLVAAANWISDGVLNMKNPKKYVVIAGAENWLI